MNFSELTPNLRDSEVGFIEAELDAGMTLAAVAENGGKPKGQSCAHARAAYDSAVRFMGRVPLTVQESQRVVSRLEALKKRLESLGEKF